jgi:transcriptional regulator with XRE-family HTH domain
MTRSFGTRLRAQREQQQVSLAAISAKLKIKVSLLEQLENDRVTYWPKGIFGRAYLRDYAREIGMDPESVVREFVMRYPEAIEPLPGKDAEAEPAPAPSPLRRFVSAAMAAVPAIRQGQTSAEPARMPAPPPSERRRGGDRREVSLSSAADVCSRLARALDVRDINALLGDAARLLDAVGVVVWLWDSRATALRASAAHGYSKAALAGLPDVHADDANAIAAAYRSGEACVVEGDGESTGAIVVPALGPAGCVGVLALEVRHGGERDDSLRAFATILAAQLGMLLPSQPDAAPSPA